MAEISTILYLVVIEIINQHSCGQNHSVLSTTIFTNQKDTLQNMT